MVEGRDPLEATLGQGMLMSMYPGLAQFKNPTPVVQRLRINDLNKTIGMGSSKNPDAVKALDYLESIYTF